MGTDSTQQIRRTLTTLARQADPSAFLTLFRPHLEESYRELRQSGRSAPEASEALHAFVMQAFRAFVRRRSHGPADAWYAAEARRRLPRPAAQATPGSDTAIPAGEFESFLQQAEPRLLQQHTRLSTSASGRSSLLPRRADPLARVAAALLIAGGGMVLIYAYLLSAGASLELRYTSPRSTFSFVLPPGASTAGSMATRAPAARTGTRPATVPSMRAETIGKTATAAPGRSATGGPLGARPAPPVAPAPRPSAAAIPPRDLTPARSAPRADRSAAAGSAQPAAPAKEVTPPTAPMSSPAATSAPAQPASPPAAAVPAPPAGSSGNSDAGQ
jgi:hypothetical protein